MQLSNKWIASAASYLGVAEYPGPKNNPTVLKFLHSSIDTDTEETPWCAAFVNFNLGQCDIPGSGSAMARSFETSKRFFKLGEPPKFFSGAIVTRWRKSRASGLGHAGFAVAHKPGYVAFLAGNQGDEVNVEWQPEEYVTGYFYPVGYEYKPLTDDEISMFAKMATSGSTKMT